MSRGLDADLTVRPSWGRRLVGIEGLRGIAALAVLAHHVGSYMSNAEDGGNLRLGTVLAEQGLTLFFVLSGFLLFRPFALAILGRGPKPAASRYFYNRAVRIFPAYIAILLVASLAVGAAFTRGAPELVGPMPAGYLTDPVSLLLNLLLLQTYFPGWMLTGIGPAWSLTAELLFYLALPVLAWASIKLAGRLRNRIIAVFCPIALLVGSGFLLSAWAYVARRGLSSDDALAFSWGQTWTAVVDRSFFAQADLFAFGMIVAVLTIILDWSRLTSRVRVGLAAAAVAIGALAAAGLIPAFSMNVAGAAAAVMLLLVVAPAVGDDRAPNVLASGLEWAPLRYLGLISFSVYLWHVPVIWWLLQHGAGFSPRQSGLALNLVLVGAVTTALASVTYFLVERPALSLKKRSDAHSRSVR